jgi:hypothetical protein
MATEQIVAAGHFGTASPAVPSTVAPVVLHGGFFGGVPLGAAVPVPAGALGDFDLVLDACLHAFPDPVEYQPHEGDPYILPSPGIFRRSHFEVDPDTGAKVTSEQPVLGVRRGELPATRSDLDVLIVRGTPYRLRDVQTDGETGARVFLHEVTP